MVGIAGGLNLGEVVLGSSAINYEAMGRYNFVEQKLVFEEETRAEKKVEMEKAGTAVSTYFDMLGKWYTSHLPKKFPFVCKLGTFASFSSVCIPDASDLTLTLTSL